MAGGGGGAGGRGPELGGGGVSPRAEGVWGVDGMGGNDATLLGAPRDLRGGADGLLEALARGGDEVRAWGGAFFFVVLAVGDDGRLAAMDPCYQGKLPRGHAPSSDLKIEYSATWSRGIQ